MSLTIYDPQKGCFVLNPANFVINAFHPDYIKTYEPDLMKGVRTDSRQTKAGHALSMHVEKMRETHPTHGTLFGISDKPMSDGPKKMVRKISTKAEQSKTMGEVYNELIDQLKPREYHTYQKAGMPKGVKK